jgi:SAM-dependent methyltransferase
MRKSSKKNLSEQPELERLNELTGGYRAAAVIFAANRLKIFEALAKLPSPAPLLAKRLNMNKRALTILLDALVSLELLGKRGSTYRCRRDTKRYLIPTSRDYLGHMLDHRMNLMEAWMDLPRVVKKGGPAHIRRRKRSTSEQKAFILAMSDIGKRSAAMVLEKIDLSRYTKMLDLGGGPGTYAIEFCRRNRALNAVVFDLPETVPIARGHIRKAGMRGRIGTLAGDYFRDEIGSGYDLVLMSNIIHSASLSEVRRLLKTVHRSMVPGGLVIVKDFLIDENRTAPLNSALFAVNMLVSTKEGNCYTPSEIKDALKKAGFIRLSTQPVAGQSILYMGKKRKRSS